MENKKIIALIALLFTATSAFSQATDPLEEYFYSSGKIKMVIVVVTIILVGLFAFLFYLENKLKKHEQKQRNH